MSFGEPSQGAAPQDGPPPASPQAPLDVPAEPLVPPAAFYGYGAPVRSKKSRIALFVGISVGAVIGVWAAGALGSEFGGSSGPGASAAAQSPATVPAAQVSVPDSPAGLTLMTGTVGRRVIAAMQKADSSDTALADAEFGAYAKPGSSAEFANLTLVPLSDSPDLEQEYQANGAAATLADAQTGTSLADSANVSTTMPGGAMTCGLVTVNGTTLRACFWVDAAEFAIFVEPSSTDNAQAARYAEAVWSASESG